MNNTNPWYSLTDSQGVTLMDALKVDNKIWNTVTIHNPKEAVISLQLTDPTLIALVSSASRYKLNNNIHIPLREIIKLIERNIPQDLKMKWKGHTAATA